MKTPAENRLVTLLGALATREGPNPTSLSGVKLYRISRPLPRHAAVYEPWIIIIAQGSKRVYFSGDVYIYDADNYLVTAVPMPVECETPHASPQNPILLLAIAVDPLMIGELLLEMDGESPSPQSVPRGLYASPLTQPLRDAAVRLLDCLGSPIDSKVLGPQFVREIVYRVLQAKGGDALCALAARDTHFGQISRVLDHLHRDYAKAVEVESLARAGQDEPFHLLPEIQGCNCHVASSVPQERSPGQGASSDGSGWLHGQRRGLCRWVRECSTIQPRVQTPIRCHSRPRCEDHAWLILPLPVLFFFGIALGVFAIAMVLRYGPAAEWFVWPIPAILSPFAAVFYPIATLPPLDAVRLAPAAAVVRLRIDANDPRGRPGLLVRPALEPLVVDALHLPFRLALHPHLRPRGPHRPHRPLHRRDTVVVASRARLIRCLNSGMIVPIDDERKCCGKS